MAAFGGLVFLAILGAVVSLPTKSVNCPNHFFGNVPNPGHCDSFILCINGFEVELFCMPGFYFNAEAASCVPDTTDACRPSYAQKSGAVLSSAPLTTNICGNVEFGLVANPDRCDAFYFCVQGQAIALDCAPGTQFDAELKVCTLGNGCAAQ